MTALPILVQFVFRLTFGMALSMAATPSSLVTAGFYRVHLWVLMGLNTFASLALYYSATTPAAKAAFAIAIALTVASYVGAVIWLYERKRAGWFALMLVMAGGLAGALLATDWSRFAVVWLGAGDILSSGLMMGTVMTAMLLGHWYLNTPTMVLAPLQRLVRWSGGSTLLRAAVCGVGIASFLMGDGPGEGAAVDFTFWLFVGFRWLAGLLGVGLMIYMTRETLKVPNTQSATGILYAAVILVFLGELVGQLLTVDARHPM